MEIGLKDGPPIDASLLSHVFGVCFKISRRHASCGGQTRTSRTTTHNQQQQQQQHHIHNVGSQITAKYIPSMPQQRYK